VGEQSGSERKAPSLLFALAGSGAKSNAVTRMVSWREIAAGATRSAKSGRMNTAEINAAWAKIGRTRMA